jgi:hypothetical protein
MAGASPKLLTANARMLAFLTPGVLCATQGAKGLPVYPAYLSEMTFSNQQVIRKCAIFVSFRIDLAGNWRLALATA